MGLGAFVKYMPSRQRSEELEKLQRLDSSPGPGQWCLLRVIPPVFKSCTGKKWMETAKLPAALDQMGEMVKCPAREWVCSQELRLSSWRNDTVISQAQLRP